MKRVRTKLVLALLLIALLPVVPVYLLVKNLLRQGIGIGFNEQVELALESASGISRELYSRYRQETVALAVELAGSSQTRTVLDRGSRVPSEFTARLDTLGSARLDLLDQSGRIVSSSTNTDDEVFQPLYQTELSRLADSQVEGFVEGAGSRGAIVAFAPVVEQGERIGSLVLTRRLKDDFTRSRESVVDVLQIFKTLDLYEEDHLTRSFLLSFFAVYLPIAAISIVVGIYFSRRITSPLLQLVQGTRQVAEGDWDYRVDLKTQDEIGALGQSFNQMVATLKEKQDQVVTLEKMAVWREIARVLAHEIKNPLTPIQLMVQQMKDKYDGADPEYDKVLSECTEIITDEIESLRNLVREFSEFARMPRLNITAGNLNALIEDVRKVYPSDIIGLELQPDLPDSEFDHEKMRRVLINLMENSMDSIRDKGSGDIRITTRLESGTIVLDYRDTGGGIPDELQDKIFEPYFSTKKSGMGLGMAIVKRIIAEHGGAISLSSRLDEGAEFLVRLPLNPIDAA